jgi:hypothetical protein
VAQESGILYGAMDGASNKYMCDGDTDYFHAYLVVCVLLAGLIGGATCVWLALAKQSKVHAFMVVMVLVAQNLSQYLKQV